MDVEDFVQLVHDMRAAQKRYYADRKQSDLIESKRLERQTDRALKEGITYETATLVELEGEPGEGIQMGFFTEEDHATTED